MEGNRRYRFIRDDLKDYLIKLRRNIVISIFFKHNLIVCLVGYKLERTRTYRLCIQIKSFINRLFGENHHTGKSKQEQGLWLFSMKAQRVFIQYLHGGNKAAQIGLLFGTIRRIHRPVHDKLYIRCCYRHLLITKQIISRLPVCIVSDFNIPSAVVRICIALRKPRNTGVGIVFKEALINIADDIAVSVRGELPGQKSIKRVGSPYGKNLFSCCLCGLCSTAFRCCFLL